MYFDPLKHPFFKLLFTNQLSIFQSPIAIPQGQFEPFMVLNLPGIIPGSESIIYNTQTLG